MTDLLRALPSGKKQKLISTILKQQKRKYQPTKQIPKKHKTHNTFLAMISKMKMPFTYVCHFKIVRPNPTKFLG